MVTGFFNFQSMLVVIALTICTCTYLHACAPWLLDNHKKGLSGTWWKLARIGERLSPWVALSCVALGVMRLY
eukprot:m51a1_g2846 putative protein kish-a-like (72) ;mRNA; r:286785-287150